MEKQLLQKMFGERCRVLRRNRGMSQEVFARSIGMDRSYYASIETGMRNVTLANMGKIAEGFGVTISELVAHIDTDEFF